MTVYNREEYLAEAIESVCASVFQDFELIIVDDVSSDKSVEIAQAYAKKDTRIRFYRNSKNLGDYPNRNQAATYANGRYLKYVDSDDTITPDCLSIMVTAMETAPLAALGLCHKGIQTPVQLTPHETYCRTFLPPQEAILGNAPLSTIIRHSYFKEAGGFSGKAHIGDGELWLKLSAYHPIILLQAGITQWRNHGDQQSSYATEGGAQYISGHLKDIAALQASRSPLGSKETKLAISFCRRRHSRYILRLCQAKQFKKAWEIKQGSNITLYHLFNSLF